MEYIKIPNLPLKSAKIVVMDGRINSDMEDTLNLLGVEVIRTKPYKGVYNALSCHPDIILHHLGEEFFVHAPGADAEWIEKMKRKGLHLIQGQRKPGAKYPENVGYNVARVGNLALHNLNYTDPVLRKELEKRDIQLIHVKQGYTKCSVSVIDAGSIITADGGIAKAAEKHGIEVLLIEPEEAIQLYELNHGFIGGSSGLIARDKWAIAGNIENLKSADRITDFLAQRGIEIVSLYNGRVVDVGTIIPIGY